MVYILIITSKFIKIILLKITRKNVIETINRNVNMITNDFFEYFDINLRLRIHEINVQNSPNDMRITDWASLIKIINRICEMVKQKISEINIFEYLLNSKRNKFESKHNTKKIEEKLVLPIVKFTLFEDFSNEIKS